MEDKNDLAFWFPKIHDAGLQVPDTVIVPTEVELYRLLDGEKPDGYDEFLSDLATAVDGVGSPFFMRTGHLSGKHSWERSCYVPSIAALPAHVTRLVEWSATADWSKFMPVGTWVLRRLIEVKPLFKCVGYGNFPVTREYRFFVRDDEVEHEQPYWPPQAVHEGRPDAPDWRTRLALASDLQDWDRGWLHSVARQAVEAVGGGYWSIDFLADDWGSWWLTDMALGDQSFKWNPEEPGEDG